MLVEIEKRHIDGLERQRWRITAIDKLGPREYFIETHEILEVNMHNECVNISLK